MFSFMRNILLFLTLTLGLAFNLQAHDEVMAIESVLMETWDTPENPLVISPVVIVDAWAIASWTQGNRGGRALLNKDHKGDWMVSACGGDTMKNIDTLIDSGIPASKAKLLSRNITNSESKIPKERKALFSTFDGVLKMDNEVEHHQPH